MNVVPRDARTRPSRGRRAPRRLFGVTLAALCSAAALPSCFNPDAEGTFPASETTSDGTSTGDVTTGSPTTTGVDDSTTLVDPTTGEDPTTGTTTADAGTSSTTTATEIDEPYCGDGVVDPDLNEECDDADVHNDDECTNFCKLPICGDGFVTESEACDDGNTAARDGCSAKCECERSSCGDGTLDPGEQCDDGNDSDRDGCSSCCERRHYFVFVTSKQFIGGKIGGAIGGDEHCNALAGAAGLPGTYHAWLAGDRNLPQTLAGIFPHPYVLPGTNEIVAHSLEELRSGQLAAAIHVTEAGEDIGAPPEDPCMDPGLRVWTGTEADGASVWNTTCANWTLTDQVGRFGAAATSGPTWASCEMAAQCDMMGRLYCFEVQT